MSVKVNESTMVYPAEKTPRRRMWLSRLDMMIRQPYSHTRFMFIYHRPNDSENKFASRPTNRKSSTFFDVEILKRAFSRVLVPFYPLSGRLKMNENNGRFEIDCNNEGALFVAAETRCNLGDLGDETKPNHKLYKEIIPTCDYSKGLSSFPLLMVQITRFNCGCVTLGIATHHHAADGVSYMNFLNCWATLARGLEISVMPCHERAAFLAPRRPPQINFMHLEYQPSFPPILPKSISGETDTTIQRLFKLSKNQINALKLIATSHEVVNYKMSMNKTLAAHVWRSVCKARGLADDQDVKLYMHTDGRSRLKDPSLPQGYFGNVIFFSSCVAKAGDIVRKPLWYTIGKIDKAVKRMDNANYLRSAVDYLESQQDLKALVRGAHSVVCPNLQINSWVRMPVSKADFGWGGPKYTRFGEIKCEGQSKIIASLLEDKCYYVEIRLYTSHMDLFEKYLYDIS